MSKKRKVKRSKFTSSLPKYVRLPKTIRIPEHELEIIGICGVADKKIVSPESPNVPVGFIFNEGFFIHVFFNDVVYYLNDKDETEDKGWHKQNVKEKLKEKIREFVNSEDCCVFVDNDKFFQMKMCMRAAEEMIKEEDQKVLETLKIFE